MEAVEQNVQLFKSRYVLVRNNQNYKEKEKDVGKQVKSKKEIPDSSYYVIAEDFSWLPWFKSWGIEDRRTFVLFLCDTIEEAENVYQRLKEKTSSIGWEILLEKPEVSPNRVVTVITKEDSSYFYKKICLD